MICLFVKGFVGNLGTKTIIDKKRNILTDHFSISYLDKIKKDIEDESKSSLFYFENDNDKIIECSLIDEEKIGKGGFLAALWKICDRNKWGLDYYLTKVPILQGTIEICEFFDLNPYRLLTSNSFIYAYDMGDVGNDTYINHLTKIDEFKNDIIVNGATYIGYITKNKKRVRIDSEVESFLIKDFKDEIEKNI